MPSRCATNTHASLLVASIMNPSKTCRAKLISVLAATAGFILLAIGLQAAPLIRIMPVGDSITYGSSSPAAVLGGYRAPLFQLLTNAGYNAVFIGTQTGNPATWLPTPQYHEGHPGWLITNSPTLPGIGGIIDAALAAIDYPDIILLLIGTNDYGNSYDTAHATNRLEALIVQMATNRPNATIIVNSLLVRGEPYNTQIQTTFNPFLPGICARQQALGRRVYFNDLRPAVPLSDMPDSLHPNQMGYNKMATNLFGVITALTASNHLVSSPNPSVVGSNITFTATVQEGDLPAGSAGGTMVFKDGGTPLSTNTVSGGTASFTTRALALGSHTMTAEYGGDGIYPASVSMPLVQWMVQTIAATTTVLGASPNPSAVGGEVTFTATVRTNGVMATGAAGTVRFKDGTATLSTNAVSGGVASFTTSALAYGSHLIKAEYRGSGIYLSSTSSPLSQIVLTPAATTTVLAARPNPSAVGEDVTFTATVEVNGAAAVGAAGSMVFKNGVIPLTTNLVSGGMATFTIGELPLGSYWMTAEYSGYGIYLASSSARLAQVVQLPMPSAPTNLTWRVSGGSLWLSWPEGYLGWILQAQTNALNGGLGANWTDIAGSEGVISANLPIVPEKPAVYYRLRRL